MLHLIGQNVERVRVFINSHTLELLNVKSIVEVNELVGLQIIVNRLHVVRNQDAVLVLVHYEKLSWLLELLLELFGDVRFVSQVVILEYALVSSHDQSIISVFLKVKV